MIKATDIANLLINDLKIEILNNYENAPSKKDKCCAAERISNYSKRAFVLSHPEEKDMMATTQREYDRRANKLRNVENLKNL
jgi:hypothetical protein